jgi:SAM-dependent methyltransferase
MTDCPLCRRAGAAEPFYPDRGIVRCAECGLVRYDGAVAAGDLYTGHYFQGGEYHDYLADKPILQRNFRARIATLRALVPGGTLLEIGAAYGFFLELAQRHWQVRGLEIAAEGVAHARNVLGLDVTRGDILERPEEPAGYDVICLWDTIEHLTEPVRTLDKIARWLRPGGYLAMTTGNIASLVSRVRKERWRLIHPPTHVTYFSPETLSRSVEHAGLRVHRVSSVGYWRSYRSMLHTLLMDGPSPHPLLYGITTLGGSLDLPVYLNSGDIMMMVAQKPGA